MIAQFFVDTNILIYAGSEDPDEASKRESAQKILRRADIGFSVQVLQEYYNVVCRKKRLGFSHQDALVALKALARRPVLPISADLVLRAADLSSRFKISYWDAAIVAAAHEMGCHTLYSEDLSHRQKYNGVTVINPFV